MASIQDSTVFYFTDNSVTYLITESGSSRDDKLHALVSDICLFEIDLRIQLVVVHIPGVVMIQQGTDGLSRGIWISNLHPTIDERTLLHAIFSPVVFHPSLLYLAQDLLSSLDLSYWMYYDWRERWREVWCFDRLTIWCPPPELGRQVITFLLNMWIEQPYTTSALVFLPRTCSASYSGLSKYIRRIGTIYPSKTALVFPPLLPIPIEVFYLAPHIPVLPPVRFRPPFSSPKLLQHRREAEEMRGLPPTPLDPAPRSSS